MRELILSTLQNRRYSLAKRLALVGQRCEGNELTSDIEDNFGESPVDPGTQLKIVLELIVGRIQLDFTAQRYLDLYKEFAQGIQINESSTWQEMGARYAAAHRDYYVPFMHRHGQMLERYLAGYAYKHRFPFGLPAINRLLKLDQAANPMSAQYMLMASYYAITKVIMIGLAANYKSAFAVEHVIHVIQSCSRTFEHCTSYPEKVRQILEGRCITNASGMTALTGDYFGDN
jgi:hypothetical protein